MSIFCLTQSRHGLRLALLLPLVLFLAGCSGWRVTPPEGNMRMAGHEWWNFYLRGRARFDAGDLRGARDDFERCLGLRQGSASLQPKEAWIVRTYGMHTLSLYFPRRELGISLHLVGDDAAARPLLEQSLRELPTARARYYLNRILKIEAPGAGAAPAAHASTQVRLPGFCGQSSVARMDPALCSPEKGSEIRDELAPRLRIAGSGTLIRTHAEEWMVSGEVADRGGLAAVFVGGEDWLAASARNTDYAVFSGLVALQPGTNRFSVVAEDMAGNRSPVETVVIVREARHFLLPEYRLAATLQWVGDAEREGSNRARLARALTETSFQRGRIPRFRLLARDGERLRSLLMEHQISLSGLADKRLALPYGEISSADLMIFLQYEEYGEEHLPVVVAHVVEAETGMVLFTEDVFVHDVPDIGLKDHLRGLAARIETRFPLIGGRVRDVERGVGRSDLTAASGIGPGGRFFVLPGTGGPPPANTEVRRVEDRFAELVLSSVDETSALGRIVPDAAVTTVQPGDWIYAR